MNKDTPQSERAAFYPLPTLKMVRDRLTATAVVADDVFRLFKFGYVISIALGLWLAWHFTTRALIPFEVDVSTALSLLAVTALAFFVFLLILIFALAPVWIVTQFPGFVIVPEGRTWRDFCRYLARYGVVFLPYLVWAFSLPLLLWLGIVIRPSLYSDPTLLGFSFFTITFLASTLLAIGALPLSVRIGRWLNGATSRDQLFDLCAASFMSWFWLLIVVVVTVPVAGRMRFIPLHPSDAWGFIILLVVMGWHFIAAWAYMAWGYRAAALLAACVVFATVLFLPVSGATFRLLGIGGGIPISATVRIYEGTSGTPQIRRIQGCLVMWLGNQVSVQFPRDDSRQISYCHLSPLTPVVEDDGANVPSVVHTLARSDVLDIYSLGRKLPP